MMFYKKKGVFEVKYIYIYIQDFIKLNKFVQIDGKNGKDLVYKFRDKDIFLILKL